MTEDEWLACSDMEQLQKFLHRKGSDRKWRLLAVACCLRICQALDDSSLAALDVVERFADGLATDKDRIAALAELERTPSLFISPAQRAVSAAASAMGSHNWADDDVAGVAECAAAEVRYAVAEFAANAVDEIPDVLADEAARRHAWDLVLENEQRAQCNLLRDIFANPFRPNAIDPRWSTATVIDLAGAFYYERAFDRMPILADALMDAGCDNEEIIAHCRGPGLHGRGCWVVDLLLGKE